MDPFEAVKATFFQECDELLGELEQGLLRMERGETDAETVNAVFRAVHSMKGGAGAFGLDELVRFAHVFENTLDDVRSGRLPAETAVMKVMLRAADMLSDHVAAARGGPVADAQRSAALAAELQALRDGGAEAAALPAATEATSPAPPPPAAVAVAPEDAIAFTPLTLALAPLPQPPGPCLVHFRPHDLLYAHANEPLLLLRELARLGEATITLDASALPPLHALDPDVAYLTWTIRLKTEAGEAAIREVFEFAEGDCTVVIEADNAAASPAEIDVLALLAEAAAANEAEAVASPEPAPSEAPPPASAAEAAAPAVAVEAAARAADPAGEPARNAAQPTTIRVDLERVDRLINLVGELVIDQAMLAQRVHEAGLARLSDVALALEDLEQLTREIQDSVMAIRAQPVKSVFQRMPRLVREVSAMTGKPVQLVTEGENTEVDKTVIERLTDPITHMIRNAIDHGLEPVERRLAAGKPAEGTVRLSAQHRSGRIVIEVADDGGGIDRARVLEIAVRKGLVDPAANLSLDEIDNLIFMPGFSTAATISDISGRGVGLDVVRRSITDLGGRMSIASEPGRGSVFSMSLPLTLAVLDGMVVTVAGQTLVVPLSAVIETLQPRAGELHTLGESHVISVRGSFVPVIDVGTILGYAPDRLAAGDGVVLLVEGGAQGRAALRVDTIEGQRQVVIKSLEANYRRVPGIAAATILGNGRVALILDVDAVIGPRSRAARAGADLAWLEAVG